MAQVSSKCLFFFLLLLLLSLSSSGTQVGFSYNARGSIVSSSISRTLSFLEPNKVTETHIRVIVADNRVLSKLSNFNVSVDLYLDESLVENFINSRSSAIFWLKSNVVAFLPKVRIKSISIRGENDLSKLLSNLKLIHSVLSTFDLGNDEIKVSAEFSLSFLENLNGTQKSHLFKVFEFIKRIGSFVIVESDIHNGVELRMRDPFIKSMVQKATLVPSTIHCSDVDIVMIVKGLVDLSAKEVAEFANKFSKSLEENTKISGQIVELYADLSYIEDFAEKELERETEQIFPSSRRKLLKTTLRDLINPPETVPTPTIVTVPATNPVTVNPTNPATTPVSIPSTTPVVVPPTIPSVNPPAPVTNPVTTPAPVTVPGGQPITNPVTTYPSPPGNVPVTTPPANTNAPPGNVPVTAPPANTNAPATPGQSWCVAKSGVSETVLQQALDYACGIGGADCSQIQQSGSCYNPNTLQNHASFAFNSYYQKNPVATSCDFGGAASIVSSNPSTGSCVFPSSSSSSLQTPMPTPSSSTTNPVTTPSTPTNPAAVPPPTAAGGSSGNVTPPSVLNSSSPGLGSPAIFPSDTPPGISTTSNSIKLHPSPTTGCFFLITYFIARRIFIHV